MSWSFTGLEICKLNDNILYKQTRFTSVPVYLKSITALENKPQNIQQGVGVGFLLVQVRNVMDEQKMLQLGGMLGQKCSVM